VPGIRAAIAGGEDPNGQHARAGTIPLQLACQGNALDAIRELLSAGADPSRKFNRLSRVDGRFFGAHTPLMYVDSKEAAALLLDAGANLDARDAIGRTPLACAIQKGNTVVFEYLMARGARTDGLIEIDGRSLTLLELVDWQRNHLLEVAGPDPNKHARVLLADLDRIRRALETRVSAEEGRRRDAQQLA
jgi:ankyrin repeat protein